ncbi:MAG: carboxypeptidase-like regulatory domain-containing protein [Syntrophomonadaceae bacterium]|nr:carboxypeptidase-like regulatory domain-containing protein [Syntrophomonadaceae bacterium]
MKKRSIKFVVLQLLIILPVLYVHAQETSIGGKVSSIDNHPIAGVTVVIDGTLVGTVTDADGRFSLKIPADSKKLVFSFIGMKSKEVLITSSTNYNVMLEEDTYSLEEVVAVGYGTMKKSDLTGSVTSVRSDEINAFPATSVLQALSGRAAGVQILQNTGAPGASISVRVRGTNSIKGGNEPLYVVDGFPISGSNPTVLNRVCLLTTNC